MVDDACFVFTRLDALFVARLNLEGIDVAAVLRGHAPVRPLEYHALGFSGRGDLDYGRLVSFDSQTPARAITRWRGARVEPASWTGTDWYRPVRDERHGSLCVGHWSSLNFDFFMVPSPPEGPSEAAILV